MLFLPMGITNGYAVVSLAYLLSQAGVSVGAVAGLVGLSLFPQTWRAVWAPLVDTTLSVRAWYLISAIVSGLLMAVTAFVPTTKEHLGLIEILVFGFSLTATFTTLAGSSLMAHGTSDEEKGRAGGWSQAGNLGGTGLGGGAGLWLAQHAPIWVSGAALGVFCTALAFVVYTVLVREAGTGRATIITYINPLVAVVLGVTLLGERPGPSALAGLVLILAGSWLSTGGGRRSPERLGAAKVRQTGC